MGGKSVFAAAPISRRPPNDGFHPLDSGDISRFSYLSVNSHVGGDQREREREGDASLDHVWCRFSHAITKRRLTSLARFRTRARARAIRKWPRKIGNRVVGVALSSASQPFSTSIVRQPVKLVIIIFLERGNEGRKQGKKGKKGKERKSFFLSFFSSFEKIFLSSLPSGK